MGNKRGSGQIRKRSDGRFEWRYTDGIDPKTGKLIRKSVYGQTWSECDRKRRQIIAEKEQYGKVLSPSSVTVEQWAQRWLDVYCDQLKDSTKKDYASRIRNGISQIGKRKLKDLTNEDVQKWVNELSHDRKPKTVKNYHGVLHDALQTAVELGMIRKNPADNIILPKVGDYDMQTLPRTDVKLFLEALESDDCRRPIEFTLYTGLRISEVLGLTWSDVDIDAGIITVRHQLYRQSQKEGGQALLISPKNGKSRRVPLPQQAVQLLRLQKQDQDIMKAGSYGIWKNPLDLVFTNPLGDAMVEQTVRKHCKKAFRAIGRDDMRFHDLRHTYAVYMIQSGVDYKTISGNMGHYSVSFTMDTYAHVTEEMERESAQKLGSFFDDLNS